MFSGECSPSTKPTIVFTPPTATAVTDESFIEVEMDFTGSEYEIFFD